MSTVLIVDDSVTLRSAVSDLLRQNGIKVLEASDGLEAKEQLKTTIPDLVIMDIVMPNMNGYELCRWLKNQPNTHNIPVVMCTSKSEDFDRYWGMKQGADAYIAKPFRPNELLATVKQLLQAS
jgi:twitching motility two-component system response regulator PilH